MRNLKEERGAVAVFTAMVLVVLLGIAAIVIDIGSLYHQRRINQNGADAAALAVAQSCAAGSCNTLLAQTYATANDDPKLPAVSAPSSNVCGSAPLANPGLSACANPPPLPSGVTQYVMVTANATVPYNLAPIIGQPKTGPVKATAVAIWGGASALSTLPLTISVCTFDQLAGVDGPDDPFDPNNPSAWGTDPSDTDSIPDLPTISSASQLPASPYQPVTIYFHTSTANNPNTCNPSPADQNVPGGFGWLQPASGSGCTIATSVNGWYSSNPGASAPCTLPSVPTIVQIPIFTNTNNLGGANGQYYIQAFTSFLLTGYRFSNNKTMPKCPGSKDSSESCITGFFINDPQPVSGSVGGPSTGATVIQLIG